MTLQLDMYYPWSKGMLPNDGSMITGCVPGNDFCVRVKFKPDEKPHIGQLWKVCLKIDGQSIGYAHVLKSYHVKADQFIGTSFNGWRASDDCVTKRRFVFATPETGSGDVGVVCCDIYKGYYEPLLSPRPPSIWMPNDTVSGLSSATTSTTSSEGNLVTTRGPEIFSEGFKNRGRWIWGDLVAHGEVCYGV